ncbi:MAG: aspartate aminotransferase family protein [Rhodospirillales bacterium]|nr:aspartate aminotransferase family protein [Alphaproteobacteria bacterium]MBL6947268.1 aspartate aminotransferase family protein [Rhodospirillales bacterium]
MTHVFQRQIHDTLPRAAKGDGIYIIDSDGKRYLDASGGAAVSCLGHSDPDVIQAIKDQVDSLAFAHTGFFSSQPAEELAGLLAAKAPDGIDMVYFMSGGSEAVEAALKMARQYFLEIGEPSRGKIIARRQSYHGNTLGALATGGNALRREPFEPLLIEVSHIVPCYAYRYRLDGETDEEYAIRAADELEAEIQRLGPDTVCAFVAETVVGATAGVVPPSPGYFKRIREICDRHGVLLILDEVMCGMGRTGTTFACEQDGVTPDIVCIAKGLGAGYQPIGAALVTQRVFRAFSEGSGFFQHGHTYMGHPTACAGALAVQRKIETAGLLDAVRTQGALLDELLHERLGNHANIGDIRGRGLFRGVELVADRASKEPFDPALKLNARIKKHAMDRGLICYPGGGTADGARGDHVLLAPPFIIDGQQVRDLVGLLGDAIDAALNDAC